MEDDSPATKTVKGAVTGLAAGTIWGTVVATWYDVPRVERHVALPGLIRTLKMCGSYGATFAAIGGLYIGVEQLVQSQRKKRDYVNGAVGAFVAGATVCGYRGKSIQSALIGGSCLAFTSAVLDIGGNTTRVDNGKEYFPYTTRDGNGYPRPETQWVFTLLGHGFGSKPGPMGLLVGQNLNPAGLWAWVWDHSTQTRKPMGIFNPPQPLPNLAQLAKIHNPAHCYGVKTPNPRHKPSQFLIPLPQT
ncbi:hypothetical protein ACP70R_027690 [Stipagrostis hirtigluma subsp. patula]